MVNQCPSYDWKHNKHRCLLEYSMWYNSNLITTFYGLTFHDFLPNSVLFKKVNTYRQYRSWLYIHIVEQYWRCFTCFEMCQAFRNLYSLISFHVLTNQAGVVEFRLIVVCDYTTFDMLLDCWAFLRFVMFSFICFHFDIYIYIYMCSNIRCLLLNFVGTLLINTSLWTVLKTW